MMRCRLFGLDTNRDSFDFNLKVIYLLQTPCAMVILYLRMGKTGCAGLLSVTMFLLLC